MPEWISVKDRLPECEPPFCKNVIVCTLSKKVMPGFCNRGDWYATSEDEDYCDSVGFDRVTHWMPLPEPPKEDS